jgi:hypothetical protein
MWRCLRGRFLKLILENFNNEYAIVQGIVAAVRGVWYSVGSTAY